MPMTAKYLPFERWPSRPNINAWAISLKSTALIPLFMLAMVTTVFAQQKGLQTTQIRQLDSRWFLTVPTAEDLMDSLWRITETDLDAQLEDFRKSSQHTMRLYQRALHRYLEELPRVQTSDLARQRWWGDFDRQQEHFWNMWRAKFDQLFEHHLQSVWASSFSHRLEKTIPLAGSPPFFVTHEFGDVVINGSPIASANLVAEIKVLATSEVDAQRYAREVTFKVVPENSIVKVSTRFPDVRPKTVQATSVLLQVELPQDCPLQVENHFGDVRVQGFTKGLRARTSHGSLEIHQCAGDLELHNRQGPIIVTGGNGPLHAETSFGPIEASNIQGDVVASNEFSSLSLKEISGAVNVENIAGSIEVVNIDGDAWVKNHLGYVEVMGVMGDLHVSNSGSPVSIADVMGQTHIENTKGGIRAEKLAGDVIILSRNGDIELIIDEIRQNLYRLDTAFGVVRVNLPSKPSAFITAEALYGTIDSDFPLEIKKDGAAQWARGKLGQGKANIQLDANNSNIYLISSGR